jgi:hypothetical protein
MKRTAAERKDLDAQAQRCWDLLATAFGGEHHVGSVYFCGRGVEMSTTRDLATHDSSILTQLVLLAHSMRCRVSIGSSGPRRVKIMVHPRRSDSKHHMEGHPGLEDLAKTVANWIEERQR